MVRHNWSDIKTTYNLLGHENGGWTEFRNVKERRSAWTRGWRWFSAEVVSFEGTNCYVGINERTDRGLKNDEDVRYITSIVLDFDAVRIRCELDDIAGIPDDRDLKKEAATDLEMEGPVEAARKLISDLGAQLDDYEANLAMSGNGAQVWMAVPWMDIETDRDHWHERLLNFQRWVKKVYSRDDVEVDNIGNPSRIIKIMGTLSVKGDDYEHRPYRLAKWLDGPNERVECADLVRYVEECPTIIEEKKQQFRTEGISAPMGHMELLLKHDPVLSPLWSAGIPGDRSKCDYIVACRLLKLGIDEADVGWVLGRNPWGKANDHPNGPGWYIDYTIKKAMERI